MVDTSFFALHYEFTNLNISADNGSSSSNSNSYSNETLDECENVVMPIDLRRPWIASTYIYGFFFVALIGVPANILSFIVIRRDRPFSTTRTLLLYLTVTDILILLCEFHNFVLKTIYDVYNYELLVWVYYLEPHVYVLTNLTKFLQVWITVIISADRYYAICFPFKASQVRTVQNADRASLGVLLLGILVNLPRVASYSRTPVYCHDRIIFKFVRSTVIATYFPEYDMVYDSIVDPLFYYFIPLVALLVFNTFLTLSVRRASKTRAQMSAHARNETSITMTLVAIVTTFIVCETPTVILFVLNLCAQVVSITDGDEIAYQHVCFRTYEEESLHCISILTLMLSSASNFFLYVVISGKFRGTLIKFLCSSTIHFPWNFSVRSRSVHHVALAVTENGQTTYQNTL